ncbi:hypothetical protein ACFZB9_04670 [Kitasatospora sp. NPDC008050]|uniref:hypothetical protein n=1 Tax=Kitasatospora sp. NPDC008050 TaxID=3364021 RepID=UPI0036E8899A
MTTVLPTPAPSPRPATPHCARRPPPARASPQPPRRAVPEFRPIRRGGSGRYRIRQAVRHRPATLATGLLAAAAIAAGPLHPGPREPAGPPVHAPSQAPSARAALPHCGPGR